MLNFQNKPIVSPTSALNSPFHQMQTTPIQVFRSPRKLEHMNCVVSQTQEMGGLYIGDIISTVKAGILESGKIQAILACSFDNDNFKTQSRTDLKIQTKIIDCHDTLEYPIKMHFDSAYQFIEKNRMKKKNVLVHCHAGVSRSGTIVCSYLIRKNNWSAEQTLEYVKLKRERVKPNENFWKQLKQYQKEHCQDTENIKEPNQPIRMKTQTSEIKLQKQFNPNLVKSKQSLKGLKSSMLSEWSQKRLYQKAEQTQQILINPQVRKNIIPKGWETSSSQQTIPNASNYIQSVKQQTYKIVNYPNQNRQLFYKQIPIKQVHRDLPQRLMMTRSQLILSPLQHNPSEQSLQKMNFMKQ